MPWQFRILTRQFNRRAIHAAYAVRAVVHLEQGENDLASSDLDAAIRLDPEYVEAYCLRGLLLKASGDAEGSARDLEKSRRLGHDCES